MRFLEIINRKKFTLIFIFLLVYVMLNLLGGERGLISYFEKQKIIKSLSEKEKKLSKELKLIEKKNRLLTENIDLDYLETLYRTKFMLGKKSEKIYFE
tara:strand:- start:670 stop:963 length:294 start_codon:yes stop_codon:yes gene_type:complete